MADQPWFDGYSGQSTDELLALQGQYRTDSLVIAFEEALLQKADRDGLSSLSVEERMVLAVEALEREVNNGGYDQFFLNSPESVPGIVAALQTIGCAEIAALTQQAIAALKIDKPLTSESVQQAMEVEDETRSTRLSELDERYYELGTDLAAPLWAYIQRNRQRIGI